VNGEQARSDGAEGDYADVISRMRGRDLLIGTVAEAQSLGIRNAVLAGELTACLDEREQAISNLKASWSWRVGRMFMSPALAIRRARRRTAGEA
jgi:hypothetical protein